MSEFKDMLKYFRMREGLSQSELAKRLGISTSTISMYEVGKRQPDFETEERIADFFNTDLNTLRGKDVEQTTPKVHTLAAHFDGDEYTEEELEEIRKFAEFVKSRRK